MNKEQIKDLIASKIAGQGSAVDAGSALPDILNGIVDAQTPLSFTIGQDRVELDADTLDEVRKSLALNADGTFFPRNDAVLALSMEDSTTIFSIFSDAADSLHITVSGIEGLWATIDVGSGGLAAFTGVALIREGNTKYWLIKVDY